MNRQQLTNIGGHPLTMNDLSYMVDNVVSNTQGCMSFLKGYTANDVVILDGCVITEGGGNYTHTEGWVWIDGEVLFVPALAVPTPIAVGTPTYNFQIDEVVDAQGTKTYYGGGVVQTRFTRTCSILSVNGATVLVFTDASRIKNIITQNLETPWRSVGAGVEPPYQNAWAGTAKVRKNKMGDIEFDGAVNHAGMAGLQRTIWTLAVADRPLSDKYFSIAGQEAGTGSPILVYINAATGEVQVYAGVLGTAKVLYLNSIRYRLD